MEQRGRLTLVISGALRDGRCFTKSSASKPGVRPPGDPKRIGMRDGMKHALFRLILDSTAVLAGCASTQVQPDRPVEGVAASTGSGAGKPQPSKSQQGTGVASNPCAQLGGVRVSKEVDPRSSNGKLASPPAACSRAAVSSGSGVCNPAGKSVQAGHYYYLTYQGYTAFGKPGARWHVKTGVFDKEADLQLIDC
jgi:hypothetical protein